MIVVIDFDGTLCEHAFPEVGAIKPGAAEAVRKLKAAGFHIIVSSCRNNSRLFPAANDRDRYLLEVRRFLEQHAIPFDEIDAGENGKTYGHFYVDDRAIGFRDNWPDIAAFLLGHREDPIPDLVPMGEPPEKILARKNGGG
ncbi:MAG: hypothetical protein GMKNLPBB_02120 [Myxococcota bacterium]|nr:hypothetical protein [Myxococcota bacterium]